jgi:CheY-like chemotaxis protein
MEDAGVIAGGARTYACRKSGTKEGLVGLFAGLRPRGGASSSCGLLRHQVVDGAAAIERAKHAPLNAAVLISAGTKMDLAETVLNLKDINPAVEIIIVTASDNAEEKAAQTAAILRALPETTVVTISEFDRYLASIAGKGRPAH